MNLLLNASLNERDLLCYDIEDLKDIVNDMSLPATSRVAADVRLLVLENALNMLDGLIELHLERLPIDVVLYNINNNLSNQCN
ncbi:hypothetical protein GCM10023149_31050 [Mucilaginibacter gynuensis]|uniref:Uncharacterized protein n=1 Tax=Mucilaginibacter gynuensis TaxID=1302236 RepID=A0ABP8GPB3_9SPHI